MTQFFYFLSPAAYLKNQATKNAITEVTSRRVCALACRASRICIDSEWGSVEEWIVDVDCRRGL